MNTCDTLIIGAGISGLSYAALSKNKDYLIIESTDAVGGYLKTTLRNGFVWDYSGHFFHFTDPNIEKWIMSGIPEDDILTVAKQTQIRYKDRLIDYPFQKNIHQLPQDEFIDCLYDLFNAPQDDFHSFREMLYCKFGKSIAEKFLIPYNEKLYACDLNKLDKDAMGRFFPYADKEDIINNFRQTNNATYNATFDYPKGGAIEYIKSVCRFVDSEKIRLNNSVISIDTKQHIANLSSGEQILYKKLVSTIPFPQLLQLCNIDFDHDIYSCNQVLVFNLGFDRQGFDTTNHWIYFPEKKYCFYRVGFYSNILKQSKMSLYVELGFERHQLINADALLPQVLHDLQEAGIMDSLQQLVDYETIFMNPAYVHINQQSLSDLQIKKTALADMHIYSIGRYGSWTYCSIEDNIKEAKELANKL